MAVKNFDKVQVGEMLHYISPFSQSIRSIKVISVGTLKDKPNYRVFKAIVNLQDKSEAITEDKLIKAHKDEGTDITKTIILQGDLHYATIPIRGGFPTYISTDKTLLEAFMEGKISL